MKIALFFITLLAIATSALAGPIDWLPAKAAGVEMVGKPVAYDPKTVIDYMDGGAEIYFRYGFKQLYQATYKLGGQDLIVELYDMGSSADAYGIFSTDLMGESGPWGQGARYQKGMIRAWKGRYFLKIASMNTSADFTVTALALTSGITDQIKTTGPLPDMVTTLPKSLKPTNIHYSHAYEDFAAAYYISTDNLLGLDEKEDAVVLIPKTDAVVADCKVNGKPTKGILIRYPSVDARNKAYSAFVSSFLRVKIKGTETVADLGRTGFAGIGQCGTAERPMIALCFEAKSAPMCRLVLAALEKGTAVGK